MSFISRAGVEMGNAVLDAYGNLMYGDDAGKAAKLVFLARPKLLRPHAASGDIEGESYTSAHSDNSLDVNTEKPGRSASQVIPSSPSSVTSQKKTSQKQSVFDLGMTFVEVNGRAYVKNVVPNSDAARAGIQPRDAVQFAFVHTDVRISSEFTSSDQDDRAAQHALAEERKGKRTSFHELCGMFPFDITYDPHTGRNRDKNDRFTTDGPNPQGDDGEFQDIRNASSALSKPFLKKSRRDLRAQSSSGSFTDDEIEDSELTQLTDLTSLVRAENQREAMASTSFYPLRANASGIVNDPLSCVYPVAIVFRRTRQRKRLVGEGAPHTFLPAFRMDDECDRACLLIGKLTPTADMAPVPDAWDEICHDGTEWLSMEGTILPPMCVPSSPPEPVAGTSSPIRNGKWNTSLSAFSIDGSYNAGFANGKPRSNSHDEFDGYLRNAHGSIPADAWEACAASKLESVKQRLLKEAKLKDMELEKYKKEQHHKVLSQFHSNTCVFPTLDIPSEQEVKNVEASIIRGMIQNAAGLAFVRYSKVVMGLSLHAGSGIVLARLPDGTWSAPSAIGTWGIGLGLQFGLEVADYLFILQNEDALTHFKSGDHFCVGGNIGAALAGMGREAFGAASIRPTLCNNSDAASLEDEALFPQRGSRSHAKRKDGKRGNDLTPIVAYAKTQGLYFGVSLDGVRIFTRHDVNAKEYKITTGRDVSPSDILSGKVATPPDAEELYAMLHSVEFAHELSFLPRPPEVLRSDNENDWRFDRASLHEVAADKRNPRDSRTAGIGNTLHQKSSLYKERLLFQFFSLLSEEDREACADFETKFKKFLYGGVSVQRLLPNVELTGGKTRRERRTLWLMLPEVGSLRLGFLSKVGDSENLGNRTHSTIKGRRESTASQAFNTTVGDDLTESDVSHMSGVAAKDDLVSLNDTSTYATLNTDADRSTLMSNDLDPLGYATRRYDEASAFTSNNKSGPKRRTSSVSRNSRNTKVQLSNKHSMALTDVIHLSQEPNVSIRFSPEDATEHLRVISIQDRDGTNLLFLANNFREAELLVCGLKLLLERETNRLGVRGGQTKAALLQAGKSTPPAVFKNTRSISKPTEDILFTSRVQGMVQDKPIQQFHSSGLPDGHSSWSQVHKREFLQRNSSELIEMVGPHSIPKIATAPVSAAITSTTIASIAVNSSDRMNVISDSIPTYKFGELIVREIANIDLPLPFPFCRALLLDSTSPVITRWEKERGDFNYEKSQWLFPPGSTREDESFSTENQLISRGSMSGAYRTSTFDRPRNGTVVKLTETHILEIDDIISERVALSVTERTPRRGFSVKMRILLRGTASNKKTCEASVLGECRPMGRNMSNQNAVHKAFCLVINEITMRYGAHGKGMVHIVLIGIPQE